MPDANELIGTDGRKLIKEPNLVVIHSKEPMRSSLLNQIAQLTRSAVLCLPLTSTFMMGKVAKEDMESIHTAIHAITEVPDINFTKEELTILHKAMEFLCERTAPEPTSTEIGIKNLIAQKLK